jgi:seryl-tRNA synthetase
MVESRSLNVRLGYKKADAKAGFVHMLNGTLCATERALCCIVENYQTPEVSFTRRVGVPVGGELTGQGLRIPKVLQPYMQGRDFLPYTAELPKNSTTAQAAKK